MASFEAGLKTLLGNLVSGRCYALVNESPTIVCPYIIFQVVTETKLVQGQKKLRLQIDVYGKTYTSAKTTADAVQAAMDGPTFATSFIMQQDLREEVSKEYRELLEYYVWP